MRIGEQRCRPADALTIALAAIAVAGSITIAWLGVFPVDGAVTFVDIEWYRRALDEVAAGRPMSSQLNYPPITLILLSPLRGLPKLAGEQLWAGMTIVVALLLAAITVRAVHDSTDSEAPAKAIRDGAVRLAIAVPLILLSFPVSFNLTTGQLSIFVMALALVGASGLLPTRFQGSLVGLASALKLTPLIFAPYYALTRQWRQLGIAAATFGTLSVIGYALFPQDSIYFWTHPGAAAQVAADSQLNVTILGILLQWPGDSVWVRIVWLGLTVSAGAAALWRARAHFLRGERFQAVLVVGIASTVISPLAWSHYQQWQVIAAVWLILSGCRPNFALGVLLYAVFSTPYSFTVFGILRDDPVGMAGRAMIVTASLVVCFAGLPRSRPTEHAALTAPIEDELPRPTPDPAARQADFSSGSCPTRPDLRCGPSAT
jgi:alpha-1,2-mannosyltransferase